MLSLFLSCAQSASTFHLAAGGKVSADFFKNKWVIVNYWASWCDICLNEIPELNNLYQHNQDKDILIYGVNYDHLILGELDQAIATARIAFPVLVEDPKVFWNLDSSDVVPVTYIINPHGRVVKKIVGPTSEAALLNTILFFKNNS